MKKTVWTVTAICLVAVLLCSAACFGTVSYIHKQNAAAEAEPSAAAVRTETPSLTLSTLGSPAASGELSATEIYELASPPPSPATISSASPPPTPSAAPASSSARTATSSPTTTWWKGPGK